MKRWVRSERFLQAAAIGRDSAVIHISRARPPMSPSSGFNPRGEFFIVDFTSKILTSSSVVATAKHYIGNEQEHFRQNHDAISSNIDDRTLHEIYMWPFQDSVKAGVGAVMCSYNQINNTAGCQSAWLQNNVLKDQLGFQGFIMSDWLAQMSGVASVLGGMDMTMPGDGHVWDDRLSLLGPNLTVAMLNSSVPIERLDDMTTRIGMKFRSAE